MHNGGLIYVKFQFLRLYDYTVLNVQPSEQFYNAVMERSKVFKDERKDDDKYMMVDMSLDMKLDKSYY